MIDYYLKFADEAQANSVLYTTTDEVIDQEGVVVQEASSKPNYDNTDIIGTIYNPTGEVETVDGFEVPVMVALSGWHVNVRHKEQAPELNAYAVTPTNPRRVWAGDKP